MSGSSTCRSCNRPIVWAVSNNGKNIPMDPEPVANGTHIMASSTRDGRIHFDIVAYNEQFHGTDAKRYRSHFASCPDAAKFRRPR